MRPDGDGVRASKRDIAARVEKRGTKRREVGEARVVMEKRTPLLKDLLNWTEYVYCVEPVTHLPISTMA
jgi:hypothetical protein